MISYNSNGYVVAGRNKVIEMLISNEYISPNYRFEIDSSNDYQSYYDETLLIKAINMENLELFGYLLSRPDIDVNEKDIVEDVPRYTPLILLAKMRQSYERDYMMQKLLAHPDVKVNEYVMDESRQNGNLEGHTAMDYIGVSIFKHDDLSITLLKKAGGKHFEELGIEPNSQ